MRTTVIAVATLAGLLSACGDDPQPIVVEPDAGVIVLETPGTDEGALMFTLAGPGVPALETLSASHEMYTADLGGGVVRVALVGELAAGAVLGISVEEGALADYEIITLEQVAARDNTLRASLTGYELLIEPLGE